MKKKYLVIGIIVLLVSFFFNKYDLINFIHYKQKINSITYSNKDIKLLKDGIYEGEYNAILIQAKVRILIKDKKIYSIDLVEYHYERGIAAKIIIKDIIKKQKIDVDNIAGATNSSKVIKKAIDNALFK